MWCHLTKLHIHLHPNVVLVKAMSQAQMFKCLVFDTFLLIVQFYPQSVNPLYINMFPTNKNLNFSVPLV